MSGSETSKSKESSNSSDSNEEKILVVRCHELKNSGKVLFVSKKYEDAKKIYFKISTILKKFRCWKDPFHRIRAGVILSTTYSNICIIFTFVGTEVQKKGIMKICSKGIGIMKEVEKNIVGMKPSKNDPILSEIDVYVYNSLRRKNIIMKLFYRRAMKYSEEEVYVKAIRDMKKCIELSPKNDNFRRKFHNWKLKEEEKRKKEELAKERSLFKNMFTRIDINKKEEQPRFHPSPLKFDEESVSMKGAYCLSDDSFGVIVQFVDDWKDFMKLLTLSKYVYMYLCNNPKVSKYVEFKLNVRKLDLVYCRVKCVTNLKLIFPPTYTTRKIMKGTREHRSFLDKRKGIIHSGEEMCRYFLSSNYDQRVMYNDRNDGSKDAVFVGEWNSFIASNKFKELFRSFPNLIILSLDGKNGYGRNDVDMFNGISRRLSQLKKLEELNISLSFDGFEKKIPLFQKTHNSIKKVRMTKGRIPARYFSSGRGRRCRVPQIFLHSLVSHRIPKLETVEGIAVIIKSGEFYVPGMFKNLRSLDLEINGNARQYSRFVAKFGKLLNEMKKMRRLNLEIVIEKNDIPKKAILLSFDEVKENRNLRKLSLKGFRLNSNALYKMMNKFPNLEDFATHQSFYYVGNLDFGVLDSHRTFSNLRKLKLSSCKINKVKFLLILQDFPSLVHLDLRGEESFRSFTIVDEIRNLQTLVIEHTGAEEITEILNMCSSLTVLRLYGGDPRDKEMNIEFDESKLRLYPNIIRFEYPNCVIPNVMMLCNFFPNIESFMLFGRGGVLRNIYQLPVWNPDPLSLISPVSLRLGSIDWVKIIDVVNIPLRNILNTLGGSKILTELICPCIEMTFEEFCNVFVIFENLETLDCSKAKLLGSIDEKFIKQIPDDRVLRQLNVSFHDELPLALSISLLNKFKQLRKFEFNYPEYLNGNQESEIHAEIIASFSKLEVCEYLKNFHAPYCSFPVDALKIILEKLPSMKSFIYSSLSGWKPFGKNNFPINYSLSYIEGGCWCFYGDEGEMKQLYSFFEFCISIPNLNNYHTVCEGHAIDSYLPALCKGVGMSVSVTSDS